MAHGLSSGIVPDFFPYIPDRVVVERANRLHLRGKNEGEEFDLTEGEFDQLVESGKMQRVAPPVDFPDGLWPCVDQTVLWFPLKDEAGYRANTAKKLLAETGTVTGDPMTALRLVRAAAHMAKLNLPSVLSDIEGARSSPSESLAEIYARSKK